MQLILTDKNLHKTAKCFISRSLLSACQKIIES